jgi:hypothetical protein
MSGSIQWQKSSFSGGDGPNCVEMAQHEGGIAMRESDVPDNILVTSRANLAAFITGVKAGEFDHLTA